MLHIAYVVHKNLYDLIHFVISIPLHVPFSPGADLDKLRDVYEAVGSKQNAGVVQKKVLRMLAYDSQHDMDDAAISEAANRTVQLAATFRVLRRTQNMHQLFNVESEPIKLKLGCV